MAQDAAWRLYTSDDGLPETWVYGITRGPSGHIWTSHGIPVAGDFDGYRVRRVPVDTFETKLSEAPDGQLWAPLRRQNTRLCDGVQRLVNGVWERHQIAAVAGTPLAALRLVAWRPGRALVMTPDALLDYDAATRRATLIRAAASTALRRFLDLHSGRHGDAWISGENGVARLIADAGPLEWTDVALPKELHQAMRPVETEAGLFVSARTVTAGGVLLRLQAAKPLQPASWTTLATSSVDDPIVAGWEGLDQWTWLIRSDGRSFRVSIRRSDGLEIAFRRMRALSGVLLDLDPDPDGGFWLATSLGVVRYLPTVWRREAALVDEDRHTGSMLESAGDVYALQDHAIARHTHDRWVSYPLPPGVTANVTFARVLAEGVGGRLIFRAEAPTRAFELDPANQTFSEVHHPEGRAIEVLGRRRPVGAWTITRAPGTPARIEAFDGQTFTVRATLDATWESDERPRDILETASGDLFVMPGPHGIGWVHGSAVEWLKQKGGLPEEVPIIATEVAPGRVWFGTREGVVEFDGSRFTTLRTGLQTVRSIVATRDGAIWVASNSGVHRFFEGSWLSLTDEDGLPDAAAVDLVEDRASRLWASTTAGIAQRHPDADRDQPETMLVPGRNPSEAAPSGDVGLSYGGVDRWRQTRTQRLLFSYRVDGETWSPFTSETNVALSGLAAGHHVFSVRAMDRNGNVDTTPAVWSFTVLLPWYREPGAMAVTALGIAALTMAVVLFATRHRRLERQVQERTEALRAELAERQRVEAERARLEEQLLQSQKMEALGRLAGGISHDFNNLLTVICSYGDLLMEEIDPADPRRQHADEIVKAASRAAGLTRQLLSFSRHQAVNRQVLDINAVLMELMRMLSRLLGERVQLKFMPGDEVWPVLSDRGQIEQVVINLVVNARDAMPEGGTLEIETTNLVLDRAYVSTHVDATEGRHVRLSVRDTGIGMDEKTVSRIFEPFFTTKEVGKGSGLGLAMVYGIVHQNGGHVVVQSAPGRGTAFDVYLPRTDQGSAEENAPTETATSRGSETILLVEDEKLVRDLASHVLTRLGYQVTTATNAEEAISLLENHAIAPDLLVSDVVMPGLGGRELATRLRQRLPGLAVLLMSGYTDDPGVRDANDARTTFLQKPFTAAALARKVQQLLGQRA